MLHTTELSLPHLLQMLDGGTHGMNVFSGNIGKVSSNCEKLPTVNYSPIALDHFPNMGNVDLSTDQQNLYNIYKALASGNCSDFALRKPGPERH